MKHSCARLSALLVTTINETDNLSTGISTSVTKKERSIFSCLSFDMFISLYFNRGIRRYIRGKKFVYKERKKVGSTDTLVDMTLWTLWTTATRQFPICRQCAARLAHSAVRQRTQLQRSVPKRYKLLPIKSDIMLVDRQRKVNSFKDMQLKEATLAGLRNVIPGNARPSPVQAIGIPTIRKGNNRILMAAETGSGKTAAYLVPIIDRLKTTSRQQIDIFSETKPDFGPESTKPRRPQCIIVVPTSLLVAQVDKVARLLCAETGLRVRRLEGKRHRSDGGGGENVRSSDIYDILISTPDALKAAISSFQSHAAAVSLANAQYLVIDEADTLFQGTFLEIGEEIVDAFEKANKTQNRQGQIIFVSATIPANLSERLESRYADLIKITTPNLHRIVAASSISVQNPSFDLSRLTQQFVETTDGATKQQLMLDIIKKHTFRPEVEGSHKMLVFCNRRQGVELLQNWLIAKGVGSALVAMTGDTRTRSKTLVEFTDPNSGKDVLITTDIMSRGIDMQVDHVVLYDTPRSTRDYFHRVGRTARAGKRGKATIFVTKQGKSLVESVKKGLRMGRVIE